MFFYFWVLVRVFVFAACRQTIIRLRFKVILGSADLSQKLTRLKHTLLGLRITENDSKYVSGTPLTFQFGSSKAIYPILEFYRTFLIYRLLDQN